MKDNIIVVGGYGHVGQQICELLAERYPGRVIAAGRNLERAQAFAATSGGRILPMRLDVSAEPDEETLRGARLVIMCLDQQEPAFVRACLSRGIHYVDISADYSFLAQVEPLHALAAESGATAVLSVGLAPGLTNLLARLTSSRLDAAEKLEITVLLGMGDTHGDAALGWTIDHSASDFEMLDQASGERRRIVSLGEGKRIPFGGTLGDRKAYRFNFADQHIVSRTLGIPDVSTRLCLDPGWLTGALAGAKRLGLLRPLRLPALRSLAVRAFASVSLGQPLYAVHVRASGLRGDDPAYAEAVLVGQREAEITAMTAALVADRLYARDGKGGVYHIEQLLRYEELASELQHLAELTVRDGTLR
ncbi:hypothetical protein PA598K_02614 [Paenibacillus sp. 598K]|uniref:saccharopine dehydrogenase family protein n=1 Tax=Paenibacillus sp. 598K TaxID=1117987 RepID=UPI000FF90994|nr:saccharopine dehydrogenase NADP-binding domain-containing protein [Paenibacillus sp. 598K]GBF74278.1 hypothetical protein PA598K_02614 [Paenibacillus sp. 598K]